ncbi:class I SAM-dependent methyltransferase [Mycobacterium parmense]|uniref:S-adenosyl-L-methionine-dependent methyltransferase n=1 Tax=Mycobacterium parmense TaxID=185642 RepID=A0A7I7YX66_9MYCO|nr:class I SAM-dependent methyltransferase [Mycobacterium parmense]MCV7350681.1 class I SAM-dependent methyltransferase [Mycobacterium parmense]ORW48378.1 SAM-dependent methyltransferase [Mycobacterium parmense]BBZ45892.1 putative S-adenosyl-L-methionine-dependent methyltransferase [Mycobacterium parmense]
MARTDDDSWEITESVGATALGVAAARAAETESDNPLISDPFARVFLNAVGEGMWSWFGAPNLPAPITEAQPDLKPRMQGMVDYMAARTAFFDSFFLDAARAGVRQVVILAAGLDSRAWRLDWPDGVTVFELDQPRVLDFKASTLREQGAQPTCNLVSVPVDLRHDWPAALREAGFDASAPSAWSAEGLLPFLPAAAQEQLFERVQALGAAGSRIAVEAPGPDFLDEAALDKQRETMQQLREVMAELEPDREIPDVTDLWYFEEREDVGDWLRRHGWDATVTPAEELMAGYDRRPPTGVEDAAPRTLFVSARREG